MMLPRCARCGKSPARLKTTRARKGGSAPQCAQQERRQACVRCGQDRPVHIRTNDGAVCSTCHERPAHEAVRGVRAEAAAGPPRRARRPGALRPALPPSPRPDLRRHAAGCALVTVRRADGNTYCRTCYPLSPQDCGRCGRHRFSGAEWPIGHVCGTCYAYVRKHPAPCTGCARPAVLVAADPRAARSAGHAPAGTAPRSPARLRRPRHAREWPLPPVRAGRRHRGSDVPPRLRKSAGSSPSSPGPCWVSSTAAIQRSDGCAPPAAPGSWLTWPRPSQSATPCSIRCRLPGHCTILRDRLVITGILPERLEYLDRIPAWTSQLAGRQATRARPDDPRL